MNDPAEYLVLVNTLAAERDKAIAESEEFTILYVELVGKVDQALKSLKPAARSVEHYCRENNHLIDARKQLAKAVELLS